MAKVRFLSDWSQRQEGDIRSGESLLIDYGERFPHPRGEFIVGYATMERGWRITGRVRFHPHGQEENFWVPNNGSATLGVPIGAEKIELWFKKTDPTGQVSWDSRYGQNYWFDVTE